MAKSVKVGNRNYTLGDVLGVGGFSEVKKGFDKETRKRVALKIMYTDENSSESEKKAQMIQVQKEIKAMKQLNHPNIIRLLGYDLKCNVGGRTAIVMVQQLAPRGELFDYLMYTKKFEQKQAISLFKQLIAGLEAMHAAGIAHRDLKPENLLFDNNFQLKLADFGFSYAFKKGEGMKTAMRTELGTKGYMAPEILNNKKYTEKADIFAAGVILFITLAGFPPFQDAKPKDWWFDKLIKKKYKLFWMAHERTAKFSPEAKDILMKMLAPQEKDRLNVYEVQKTSFFNSACLTKEELVTDLKKRKKVVEAQKEPISRDVLADIIIKKGDLLPDEEPVLLRNLVQNNFKKELAKVVESDAKLNDVLQKEFKDGILKDLQEKAKQIGGQKFAASLLKSEYLQNKEFHEAMNKISGDSKEMKLDEKVSEQLLQALRKTDIGVVDDMHVLKKFINLEDASIKIPEFHRYRLKQNAYHSRIGFGLLAYCCHTFAGERGKLVVNPQKAQITILMGVKKVVVLPEEVKKPDGTTEVVWRKGQLPCRIEVTISLQYDPEFKRNIVSFEYTSKDKFAMNEYSAIVKELKTNPRYLLRHFLEKPYSCEDADNSLYEIDAKDIVSQDGDHFHAEENIQTK